MATKKTIDNRMQRVHELMEDFPINAKNLEKHFQAIMDYLGKLRGDFGDEWYYDMRHRVWSQKKCLDNIISDMETQSKLFKMRHQGTDDLPTDQPHYYFEEVAGGAIFNKGIFFRKKTIFKQRSLLRNYSNMIKVLGKRLPITNG